MALKIAITCRSTVQILDLVPIGMERLIFLFGDTWKRLPNEEVVSSTYNKTANDILGFFDSNIKPSPEDEHPKLNFFSKNGIFETMTTIPPTVYLGDGGTPLGIFSTKKYLYAAFTSGLHVQLARYKEGTKFELVGHEISHDHPEQIIQSKLFGPLDMFFNVAFATAPDGFPAISILKDGQNVTISNPVFVWGRSIFWKISPKASKESSNLTDLYLMVLDGDELDAVQDDSTSLTRLYFLGFDEEMKPIWGNGAGVKPMAILDGAQDIPFPNQMSVTFDKNLNLWMMLYGGSIDDSQKEQNYFILNTSEDNGIFLRFSHFPWGPWSEKKLVYNPRPLSIQENSTSNPLFPIPNGIAQPTLGSVVLHDPKSSRTPPPRLCTPPLVGPTGEILISEKCSIVPVPSDKMLVAGKSFSEIIPQLGNYPQDAWLISGSEYGASFWAGASYSYEQGKGIIFYFLMSTFNPYRVILMKGIVMQLFYNFCTPDTMHLVIVFVRIANTTCRTYAESIVAITSPTSYISNIRIFEQIYTIVARFRLCVFFIPIFIKTISNPFFKIPTEI